jgi:nanoRNase/pAp phosphatase (c-di-AMP/oligoRNAs hydrolase)
MLNTLGIEISKVPEVDLGKFSSFVVLDTDLQSTGFARDGIFIAPHIRIDHHDMRPSEALVLEDIRPVGSTCSLVWEYLCQAEIDLSSHADVVTALVLGIKTDTLEFSADTTSDLDYEAFRSLIPHVDRLKMAKLTKYVLPQSLFEHESRAYNNHIIKNSVLVTSIGRISALRRDDIPMIADRFSRMDAISTVVVLGFIEDYMVASIRSQDSRVNVYDLCCALFGKDFCGAKAGSGGAKVPLGMMSKMISGDELKNAVEKSMLEHIAAKLFSYLGEE